MYSANKIIVNTNWTQLNPEHDVTSWSVYPVDGDVIIQLKDEDGWGDEIQGYQGVPMGDDYELTNIRIKALTGSVQVSYYLS